MQHYKQQKLFKNYKQYVAKIAEFSQYNFISTSHISNKICLAQNTTIIYQIPSTINANNFPVGTIIAKITLRCCGPYISIVVFIVMQKLQCSSLFHFFPRYQHETLKKLYILTRCTCKTRDITLKSILLELCTVMKLLY